VTPIEHDSVRLSKQDNLNDDSRKRRQLSAEQKAVDENSLSSSAINMLMPHDIVGYKKPGVQEGVFKKLRLGKYAIDGRLDLHHFTVDQARQEIFSFIQQCLQYELRCVLVMPGKGGRDKSGVSVLKSHVASWLEELAPVLAYHSAQPFHGGGGAFYVLLQKSEEAKQKNREAHGLQ
jgi:DNA-nicking Smr family endonuclease